MANDIYTKELHKIMTNDDPPAASIVARPRAEIEARVAEISQELKGPMNNVERLWLVEERTELRKALGPRP